MVDALPEMDLPFRFHEYVNLDVSGAWNNRDAATSASQVPVVHPSTACDVFFSEIFGAVTMVGDLISATLACWRFTIPDVFTDEQAPELIDP